MSDKIAYQNKDIISKTFMESFGNKSLEAYGIHLPRIVRLLPTNIPTIEANELRLDNLLELEDGSLALFDYESDYKEEDMAKYMNYLSRIYKRLCEEGRRDVNIRMIVIYTADVRPNQVETEVQKDGFSVRIRAAFLSELKSEEIRERIAAKIQRGETLLEKEIMELIILPLTYRTREKKQESVRDAIELAKQIGDAGQSKFAIAGLVVFSDKIIDNETKERAKRWIEMTTIGRMFEEEKEEAVRQATTQIGRMFEREKEEAVKKATEAMVRELAKEKEKAVKEATEAVVRELAKEKEVTEEKEKELAKEKEDKAKMLVKSIENTAKGFGVSVEEACEKMGITNEEFDAAKTLVGRPALDVV